MRIWLLRGEAMLGKQDDYLTVAASIMGLWLIASSQCNSTLGLGILEREDLAPADAERVQLIPSPGSGNGIWTQWD